MQTDLNAITSSATFQTLLSLEGMNADKISEFMSSPVEIETETFYSVKNYGSSMTPFYTNLAIWVGGIVLIAILKMEVNRDQTMRSYGSVSLYFGRWLLFITVGMIQGFIVCLGDVLLPGIQCVHPAQFILTGVICSSTHFRLLLNILEKHCASFSLFYRFPALPVLIRLK